MTTTIITGQEPRVRRKNMKIAIAREALKFSDAHVRQQYGIPEPANAIRTELESFDMVEVDYVWFEVTVS